MVLVSSILAGALLCYTGKRNKQEREAEYRTALQSFTQVIKPGMNRKEVEDYLHGKNRRFRQMCCIGKPQNAWADLVKIGKESPPWYCSEHNIFIAFEFAAVETHDRWQTRDSDRLEQVTIFRWLEGCL